MQHEVSGREFQNRISNENAENKKGTFTHGASKMQIGKRACRKV